MYYDDVKANFSGTSYTIDNIEGEAEVTVPDAKYDLERIPSKHGRGLWDEGLHYGLVGGGNSGYQAVNLAYLLGAKTILLLGLDMYGTHYFGPHPSGLVNGSPFDAFIKCFETIDRRQVEIINCSRRSALTCFPSVPIEYVLS